jgi:WD40 repeat protein
MTNPFSDRDQTPGVAPDAARQLWTLWRRGQPPKVAEFLALAGSLTPVQTAAVLLVDQRERWQTGDRVSAETYLLEFPVVAADFEAAVEVVYGEFLLREEQHEELTPEDYLRRFPQFAKRLRMQIELHRAMGPESWSPSDEGTVNVSRGPAPDTAFPVIAGYKVIKELGRGGMGVVYLARHLGLKRLVALKIIRSGSDADAEQVARFRVEAEAVARLAHPHIVQIHDIGHPEGGMASCSYLALEYVEGATLAQTLGGKPQPASEAAALVETLARAMHFAHQRGILHRDLKPANILLQKVASGKTKDESRQDPNSPVILHPSSFILPKITDFGLAKLLEGDGSGQTQTGAILGTPGYMAPEQASGRVKELSVVTDVYALGAILYECLTGRPPFQGTTPLETLNQVQSQEPVPPSRLQRHLPRDLETICLTCLRKEPGKRYPSAEALADDLHRYLAGQPIKARRVGALGRAALWARRNPALASTIIFAVAAVVAVAGVGFWQVLQERNRFRDQRDRAEANLYRALVGEARAQLQARDTGWWWRVLDNLREAGQLNLASQNRAELRELAIECMGTEYPCMRLHGEWAGHTGPVTTVALSRDGYRVVSGSRDGTVRLWSMPNGQALATLAGHAKGVTGVAFHPDGRRVASSSLDGTVRLWDVGLAGAPAVLAGTASEETRSAPIQVWEPQAGFVRAVAFSPDGAWLAAACQDGTVHLFPVTGVEPGASGRPGHRVLKGHAGPVNCLAFSPTEGLLASGSADLTIRFWDVALGKQTTSWAVPNPALTLEFHLDGVGLLWGDAETFGFGGRLLQTNRDFWKGRAHSGAVFRVTHDFKQRWLTASGDGTLKVWQGSSYGQVKEVAIARGEFGACLSAEGSRVGGWVVAGYIDGRVRLWELVDPPQRALDWRETSSAVFIGRDRRLAGGLFVTDLAAVPDALRRKLEVEAVTALAVHPAGRQFAFAREGGSLHVWDHAARRELIRWQHSGGPIRCLAASPDGQQLAGAAGDRVQLWDWKTSRPMGSRDPGLGAVHAVVWGRDGRHLAATGERGVVVWDVNGAAPLWRLDELSASPRGLAFGLDTLAIGTPEGAVELRDPRSGRPRHTLRGHMGAVGVLAFSADGRRLASSSADGTIRLWDPASGETRTVFRDAHPLGQWLTFDPTGRYLAGVGLVGTSVWDLQTGATRAAAYLYGGNTKCGCFVANESVILMGNDGAVRQWAMAEVDQARAAAAGTAQDKATEGAVRIDSFNVVVPGAHVSLVWGVAASPDGRWLATSSHDQTVKLWDAQTLKLVRTLEGHREVVWCVAFSPDSRTVASGSAGEKFGEVKVWDVATGRQLHHFDGHAGLVMGLAFHPHRPWLASGANDGSVHLWDVAAGRPLGLLHQFAQSVHGLAFRPDGRWLAAACHDHRAALWELGDAPSLPKPPDRLLTGHSGEVWGVGFSADGRYLASGGDGGVITLWDGDSFDRVVTLRGGTAQIRGISFSHDGQLLAGAAHGGPTIIWDLAHVHRTLRLMDLDW